MRRSFASGADQVLLTNGPATLSDEQRARLRALQIEVREEPIARLESEGGRLSHVVADGERLARSVLFLARPCARAPSWPCNSGAS